MECVTIGDLHTTDAAGSGGLAKYIENPDRMIMDECRKVMTYAQNNGIETVIFKGDICNGPRMSYSAMLEASSLFEEYPDLEFHLIPGNHDMFGETTETGHSLEVLSKLCKLPNVKFHTEPKTYKIDGARVRFLPYPHEDFDLNALNIFHKEVYGSKGDSGRAMKDDKLSKTKAVVAAGHLHTAHRVRNTHYSGTLYQTNFGESLPKYFHHVQFNSAKDYQIDLIEHDPTYKLHNIVLNTRDDLQLIPHSRTDLVKLVIQDGADVSAADYSEFQNIVVIKNFKSKEDLKAVLLEDLAEGEELIVKTDDFFEVWLESLDVETKMRGRISGVRQRVLNGIKA